MYENLETLEELSERLKVPKSWIYRQTMRNDETAIPKIKLGKYLRFIPGEVDQWILGNQGEKK